MWKYHKVYNYSNLKKCTVFHCVPNAHEMAGCVLSNFVDKLVHLLEMQFQLYVDV